MLKTQPAVAALGLTCLCTVGGTADPEPRPWIAIRGIYGGIPDKLIEDGKRLADYGINAVWLGSGSANAESLAQLRAQGVKVFAEFNTLHVASYIKDHPDAAPVGTDGQPCPPPHGWQGVSPTHEGYRKFRMDAFRDLLANHEIDGVWLDYHHSHASWERADPAMPDTGFDPRSLAQFQRDTGVELPDAPTPELAGLLLGKHREAWVQWRCDVLTDWAREFREILDATRPDALLGSFHCPWSEDEHDGALRNKLHIDVKAQAAYIDIFSPMPYHARFGHGDDPAWISRQVEWLGRYLGIEGQPDEKHRIWPIVQLADWGEPPVPAEQVRDVLDHGTRRPATGVMVFHWSGLRDRPDKTAEVARFFLDIRP
jgi:hypothetical protein